jgi:hypothetical protein
VSHYAQSFLALINDNFLRMSAEVPPLKSRSGRDLGYRENSLRAFVRTASLPEGLLIERKLPNDPIPACVDYRIVDGGLRDGFIRATCELKGPTRMSFLEPPKGLKWRDHFLKDITKQHARAAAMPDAEHFVALLLPVARSDERVATIIEQTVARVRAAIAFEAAIGEVRLRYPLTTVILRVL